jgi:beta-N-acetylhexosaminidase
MDSRLLAAQTIMTGINGAGALDEFMEARLRAVPAGGIMLFKYNLTGETERIPPFLEAVSALIAGEPASSPSQDREALRSLPGILPFVAVDHEGGSVFRFSRGVSRLPAPGSYWEASRIRGPAAVLAQLEAEARKSGEELRALGIRLNLAPVAEVLTQGNRAFLDDRSYGPDPAFTAAAAEAFVRGMEAAGIACAVKHFPGHAGEDPHRGRVSLAGSREALDAMTSPFAALIRRGTPMIMVSHALVPAWDGERIASLSAPVIRQWLRETLGFKGIILADDFSMAALEGRNPESLAVEALNAGVDMVMAWPMNLLGIHRAIVRALEENRLPRRRLEEAAERILAEKLRLGLIALPQEGEEL